MNKKSSKISKSSNQSKPSKALKQSKSSQSSKPSKNLNIYEENCLILEREVTHYRNTYLKKESKKNIKIEHFLKYFESKNNSFTNTPLNLIWKNNCLTQNFLNDIAKLEYNDIIPLIIQLLIGDFSNTKKKEISNKSETIIQKLYSFYILPIEGYSNSNILFCLCLQGEYSPSSYIYFLSISSSDYKEKALEFLDKINDDDDNFPLVEFDKNGLHLVKEILFSHKEKDEKLGKIICYPLNDISLSSNRIFSRQIIHKKEVLLFNDSNDFKDNELNESIISQIEKNQYENLIISIIEGTQENWSYKLSQQEKKYVKNSDTFILSGRPGTGKTTVILFKLFSIYFNYRIKKNQRISDYQNRNSDIINLNDSNKSTESLRVVFTSLSQTLCEKQQNIFEETMVRKTKEIEEEYSPISSQRLKLVSSFRNLSEYPIFANFRKLMFMIDGSLTFQFFSRHNLSIYEGDHDTEYFYSKDYIYDVNEYSFYGNNKHINFFYRSPYFSNVVELKEANENTFISFYKSFLSQRKSKPLAQTLYSLNLNPLEIYAQLISIIKGSFTSHFYMNNCISKEEYKEKGRKLTDLPNLDDVYELCMLYENYKKGNFQIIKV